ncbi:MAG TPA: type II toxin-antitoxin system VapC family toxin [Terrimicrobiaceae bacterium]
MNVDRLVDTDFLIDRWRKGESSDAAIYARAHANDSLAIPWIVKGELLYVAGIAGQDSPRLLELLARYPTHWPDEGVLLAFARLKVHIVRRSITLRTNDLWIAVSALRLDVPLVTRNTGEFGKVPGIKLDPY